MAKTTYDTVYTQFSDITKVDEYDLPSTDNGRYNLINSGRKDFNRRLGLTITQDDIMEEFSLELTDSQILILAHCMKYVIVSNMLSDFVSTYSMYQKEVGFKDYKAQLDGRMYLVNRQDDIISDLIFSTTEDYDY